MFQFPANPIVGQLFTPVAGITYRWNGVAWFLVSLGALSKADADLIYQPLSKRLININPHFQIDQIKEGGIYPINGAAAINTLDAWSGFGSLGGSFTVQRVPDPLNGYERCMEVVVNVADASVNVDDRYFMWTVIEGYDAAVLKMGQASAKNITIQFALQSNVAPLTLGLAMTNAAQDRSYVTSIAVPDTAEHDYSFTIPMDTIGLWQSQNLSGIYIYFGLMGGANNQAPTGAWQAGGKTFPATQSNFMATLGNTLRLKRFEVFAGDVAQPYTPFDIQSEYTKCQRYYYKSFPVGTPVSQASGVVVGTATYCNPYDAFAYYLTVAYPVELRAAPVVTYYNPILANANWQNQSGGTNSNVALTQINGTKCITINNPETGTDFKGSLMSVHFTANARLS